MIRTLTILFLITFAACKSATYQEAEKKYDYYKQKKTHFILRMDATTGDSSIYYWAKSVEYLDSMFQQLKIMEAEK